MGWKTSLTMSGIRELFNLDDRGIVRTNDWKTKKFNLELDFLVMKVNKHWNNILGR